MPASVSSMAPATSGTRSWLARDRRRTRRPNRMIGATTSGTTSATSPVSFGEVISSKSGAAQEHQRVAQEDRDGGDPTTTCRTVVSAVSRDTSSAGLLVS
jgi:hypothetical protein